MLTVATWNVLADSYVKPQWFPGAPAHLLRPGARVPLVVDLVTALAHAADVVALQEVELPLVAALAAVRTHTVHWCPKGHGRPDGCALLVRTDLLTRAPRRLDYQDGTPTSGHVAQLLELDMGGQRVVVANTHVRFAPADAADHVGVRQVRQLVDELTGADVAVLAADLNDLPGGPVRAALCEAGLQVADSTSATSLFAGHEHRALDVIASRGSRVRVRPWPLEVSQAMPSLACPSDHVPVLADVLLDR